MKNISKIIKMIPFLFFGIVITLLTVVGCEDDIKFNDNVPDYTYSIIRDFKVNGQSAIISHTNAVITFTLPAGSDLTKVPVNITLPEGATVEPASGSIVDFSAGPVIFTVSNNGISRKYTATVAAYGDPMIMSFSIGEHVGVIDADAGTIAVTVGSQEDIKKLTPLYIIPGGTTATPQSGIAQDFTSPVKYTVVSNDGFTGKSYYVSVTQLPSPFITSFKTGTDICSITGIVDNTASTIVMDFPSGSNLSSITPIISLTAGSTIAPASGVAKNFSTGPVNYTVTNVEGLTKTYAVTARIINSTKKIAFVSGASCVESISEPDTKAAALWLKQNYAEDFVYIQASDLTAQALANTKVLLLYWDNVGTQKMPDTASGITTAQVDVITNYYKAGGGLIVEGFGINLLDEIGRVKMGSTVFANNGGNTDPVGGQNLDAWGLRASYSAASPSASANHPLLVGLSKGTTDYYPMNNAKYKEDRNFGIDFGPYDSSFTKGQCSEDRALEFEAATNSVLIRWYEWLDARGCGIGLAEFKPQGAFQGTMIVNTGGWLEWSMADNNGVVNDFQNNIYRLHKNAIDLLLSK